MKKGQIDIITLGCSKNLVDAEKLMARLENVGYTCVHDADKPEGEFAVVNTCGFIGDAKEESINTILECCNRKKHKKLSRLYVMGCLSQRYLEDLKKEIPEVDAWFGKFNFMDLLEVLGPYDGAKPQGCRPFERVLTTPQHYEYLKISEGCNRFCSYCAIPLITGRHTSRPIDEILDEVRWMVSKGVQEFNVIAQDLSSYGTDLLADGKKGAHLLPELIDKMAEIDGVRWIRLHYAYPTDFPYEILPVMTKHPNVCRYIDIALQHATDHMLTIMRRHITKAEQDELITRIRREVPGICIRTTLLVGHPGETEEDFNELCEWARTMRFDRMGAFAYSEEEGTYAAEHYSDDIPQEVKDERVSILMDIQQRISKELQERKVGNEMITVVDREEQDYYVGRTEFDSPEVDCEVLIRKTQPMEVGKWYTVKITGAEEFDLYAERI